MARQFNKVALSFHAHPDDAEAWNAGVLKLLKDKGYRIVIATMTGGDLGGCNMTMEETAKVRYEEAGKAAAVLDAEYYTLGGTDGFLSDSKEFRLKAISLMRKVRPEWFSRISRQITIQITGPLPISLRWLQWSPRFILCR